MPNQENEQVIAARKIRSRSVDSVVDSPTTENAPLPDFEKSSITPPPVHDHPAYQPLSGDHDSSKIRTYRPKGRPTHSPSSSMTQHPAYHVSQLNQHPAFRSSSGPSSSRSTAELPQHFPSQRSPRKEAYMRREAGNMLSEIPIPFSPAFSSPIPGRSELPAEVPVAYRAPTPVEIPGSYPTTNSNAADTNGNISRENTQASSYSTPIGVGVSPEGKGSSNVPPVPHFKAYNPGADADDYQIKIVDIPRSNSTSKQKQIQSYDGAYDEVDLSPVGNGRWSGSTVGEGMDRLDVAVEKREVDELTPLSQVYRESWSERGSWCKR
jgi:hypothetical protein